MDRRSFLMGTTALLASQGLASCSGADRSVLRVRLLKNSIPPQLVQQFRRNLRTSFLLPYDLDFKLEPQLQGLYSLLDRNRPAPDGTQRPSWLPIPLPFQRSRPRVQPTLVTLGDAWLTRAIQQELIQPLEVERLQGWAQLPEPWRTLVTRNRQGQPEPTGLVWGAPYRWGSLVLAYRADRFRQAGWALPLDWADLWRPELRGLISLPDSPRVVLGLTLKKLGQSFNHALPETVPELQAHLQALQHQVRLYSSDTYLQPLILGDTAVAVGWSTDILTLMQTNAQIAAIVPRSGTILWAELWVQPTPPAQTAPTQGVQTLAQQWIDFFWQPPVANQLSLLSQAASPLVATADRSTLPPDLQQRPILLPPPSVLDQSEYLYPLPLGSIQQYQRLWEAMRRMG